MLTYTQQWIDNYKKALGQDEIKLTYLLNIKKKQRVESGSGYEEPTKMKRKVNKEKEFGHAEERTPDAPSQKISMTPAIQHKEVVANKAKEIVKTKENFYSMEKLKRQPMTDEDLRMKTHIHAQTRSTSQRVA